jgi:hypothetical protein
LRNDARQALQLVYDDFYDSGGVWPTLGDIQRTLNRESVDRVNALRIVRRIPPRLLKPLPGEDPYPALSERLVLTAEGIKRCKGSSEDVENFMTAIKWLAKMAGRAELSNGQGGIGVRFTTRQLAEAVSLPLDADRIAVSRLVAILHSEGWV